MGLNTTGWKKVINLAIAVLSAILGAITGAHIG